MYNHKWEVKFGDTHLHLSVPKNIDEILNGNACSCVSEDHFCGQLTTSLIEKRQAYLREKMMTHLVEPFEEWAMYAGQDPNDIYNIEQWPMDFDINNEQDVPPIPSAPFKEKPDQPKKSTSTLMMDNAEKVSQINEVIKETRERDASMKSHEPNETYLSSDTEKENDRSKSVENLYGVSQNTLDAIKKKSEVENDSKKKSQDVLDAQESQKKIGEYLKIVNKVLMFMQAKQGNTVFFSKILDQILSNQQGTFLSKGKQFIIDNHICID